MEEAKAFFDRNAVAVLVADLAFTDPDTIFTAKLMTNCDAGAEINDSEEPIMAYVPLSVINGKRMVWIDASEIRHAYTPDKR